jgi:tellurite resistance protein
VRFNSETLLRLRDDLRRSGERRSIPPSAPSELSPELPPDMLAVVQRVAPMCEVLYLLMVADQHRDERELEVLRGAIRALTEGTLRSTVIDTMVERFAVAEQTFGRDVRLSQVTGLLAADRHDAEAAFTLAAVMAIADDTPDEHERSLLEELREMLGIKRERARALLGELRLA